MGSRSQLHEFTLDFGGPVLVTHFTAASDTTALVPSAGMRLEIIKVIVDAPDGAPTDTVWFTDG